MKEKIFENNYLHMNLSNDSKQKGRQHENNMLSYAEKVKSEVYEKKIRNFVKHVEILLTFFQKNLVEHLSKSESFSF